MTYSNNKSTTYVYDATGRKLQVEYVNPATTFDYCGNMIYVNGTLDRILVDDGYIEPYEGEMYYSYYLKDHQGNNRVVAYDNGVVAEVNHYYPFGLLFGESEDPETQKFKYNNKEFDRYHGLDMYDYGARFYDPSICRFTTMDPMCEKYYNLSPYIYCGNNPVRYVDPSGMDWYQDKNGNLIWNSNLTKENAKDLLSEQEKYLSYSSDGRIYATDDSGVFFYGDNEGKLKQLLMPEIVVTGHRNPQLYNSLAYSLMGFRGVADSGQYGPWSPSAMSIEAGISFQFGNAAYSYGLGFISGDNESAIYTNINSSFAGGFKLCFGGYASIDYYNKTPNGATKTGIGVYENSGMNWNIGLGLISINHGYGTRNGYFSDEYNSYGISLGTGVGFSFGASNSTYIKRY